MKRNNQMRNSLALDVIENCWKVEAFLITFFYSSMILAGLIVKNDQYIDSMEDVANSKALIACSKDSLLELNIKVFLIIHSLKYL